MSDEPSVEEFAKAMAESDNPHGWTGQVEDGREYWRRKATIMLASFFIRKSEPAGRDKNSVAVLTDEGIEVR